MNSTPTQRLNEIAGRVPELSCLNPIGNDTEYVSQDMATDAGEPEMAGSVYREAEWQRCGGCEVCLAQQALERNEDNE